ncbi:protein of unknown function DUF222/HNH endonuclease [Actinobacteria bacterium IMCC26207]|nr:protein of unknown function DUF222/HNH endonuclease [Actinobacteria bacterium IMCC26207]
MGMSEHGQPPEDGHPPEDESVLNDRIGVLAAHIHILQAQLVATLAEYNNGQHWKGNGYKNFAQWVSVRTKFTPTEARRYTTIATNLTTIPALHNQALQGRVSLGLLEHAARISTPDNQAAISDLILNCTPAQATRLLATYKKHAPQPDSPDSPDNTDSPENPDSPDPDYYWRTWQDHQGRGRIDAALDPITTALLQQAWAAAKATTQTDATQTAATHDTPTTPAAPDGEAAPAPPAAPLIKLNANQIAQRLAQTMLDHTHDAGIRHTNGEHFNIQINLDVQTLANIMGIDYTPTKPTQLGTQCFITQTGQHLTNEEIAAYLTHANMQLLIQHNGVPLWLSNTTRTATRQQRRALNYRSGGQGTCEFPGCTQNRYLKAHHVNYHSTGGTTSLENLILLCQYHHNELHTQHWTITTNNDQIFTFWNNNTCLGTTTTATTTAAAATQNNNTANTAIPQLQQQHPKNIPHPPKPPPHINPDTPKSTTRGERLTHYAADVYLAGLLTNLINT